MDRTPYCLAGSSHLPRRVHLYHWDGGSKQKLRCRMSCGNFLPCHSLPMMMQPLQICWNEKARQAMQYFQRRKQWTGGWQAWCWHMAMPTHFTLHTTVQNNAQSGMQRPWQSWAVGGHSCGRFTYHTGGTFSGRRSELDRNSFVSTFRVNCGCAPLARMVEQDSDFARIELGNRHAGPFILEEHYDVVRHVGGCILVYSAAQPVGYPSVLSGPTGFQVPPANSTLQCRKWLLPRPYEWVMQMRWHVPYLQCHHPQSPSKVLQSRRYSSRSSRWMGCFWWMHGLTSFDCSTHHTQFCTGHWRQRAAHS